MNLIELYQAIIALKIIHLPLLCFANKWFAITIVMNYIFQVKVDDRYILDMKNFFETYSNFTDYD
jgi:hypothetical protein